jgi:hypothetical protein
MAEKRELSAITFAREFADFFSPARAMQLLGFCLLWRTTGFRRPAELANRGLWGLKRAAVYRCLVDLRRFREHLVSEGYSSAAITDEANTYEREIEGLGAVAEALARADASNVSEVGQKPAAAGRVEPATS